MAKAREIPGLDPGQPFAKAAAAVVATRAAEVIESADGVLDLDDVERVHAMRVATRRLRASLEVFASCFDPDRFEVALRDVKALADALGERRDRDVALLMLEEFSGGLAAADRRGIDRLADEIRGEQRTANEGLADALGGERLSLLSRRLDDLVTAG